jgi:hypothetical protein
MSYSVVAHRMLISCPSDVPVDDLRVVHQAINRWNGVYGRAFGAAVLPISWGTHAAAEFGAPPQDIINKQLVDQSDICLALFASRLGTPTASAESGTAEEIERISDNGGYVAILRSRRTLDPKGIDHEQAIRLDQYLAKIKSNALVLEYASDNELSQEVDTVLVSAVSNSQGRVGAQLQQSAGQAPLLIAEIWPRVESAEQFASFGGRGQPVRIRDWFIVLTNTGGAPAQNVTITLKPISEGDIPWRIFSDTPNSEPQIDVLAPNGEARFQLLVVDQMPIQMNCVVSWSDQRGRQQNTATLRLT